MLQMTPADKEMLSGARGPGVQLAMRMIVRVAEVFDAPRLIDIEWAHVASAYHQGQANVDFARRLADAGTMVAVPTTLTACSLNLRSSASTSTGDVAALELIDVYENMGCIPAMTCAPYHVRRQPRFGEHLAWCESSAVVYANSVLGARTNRYVEFVDMCAAVTGRVPDCGLHRTEERRATVLFRVAELPEAWFGEDWFYHVLGIWLGCNSGPDLPAIDGLPEGTSAEQLRSLGSAATSAGSIGMFHAIGLTPEANTITAAFQGACPRREQIVSAADIRESALMLGRGSRAPLTAVCVGAPHFSLAEFELLHELLGDRVVSAGVRLYASTSAAVLAQLEKASLLKRLANAGVEFVVGRCTYYRPAMAGTQGHVMTNSAKWAYYAPSGLGAAVTFASLDDCVDSACAGRVLIRDEG